MSKIITLLNFIFRSIRFNVGEILFSISLIFLSGVLFNLYTERNALFEEHSENKRKTEESIIPLDRLQLVEYQRLLSWFNSSTTSDVSKIMDDKILPINAKLFIKDVSREAKELTDKLNIEMTILNELQNKAVTQSKNKLKTDRLDKKQTYTALTKAYEKSNNGVLESCEQFFGKESVVVPQSLATATKKAMLRRSYDETGSFASTEFSIVSTHSIPSKHLGDREYLKEKTWTFRPTCHLFNLFGKELQQKLKSTETLETINDKLTAMFAPKVFSANSKGELTISNSLEASDPNLRVRAAFIGVQFGSRISFPGTKYTKKNQVLYDPADRPWFKLVDNDQNKYQIGDCAITAPYADIGSQLLVVRTIVCKGETISKENADRQYALGIDLVINQSKEKINKKLADMSSRLASTAKPFEGLTFEALSIQNTRSFGKSSISGNDKPPSLKLVKNDSGSFEFIDSISKYALSIDKYTYLNPGSMTAASLLLLISILRIRPTRFAYASLTSSILFGGTVKQRFIISRRISLALTKFISLVEERQNIIEQENVVAQTEVRAKQSVDVLHGRSVVFSIFGMGIYIPFKINMYEVKFSQDADDFISIFCAKDIRGNDIDYVKDIEPNEQLMSAITIAANEPFLKPTSFIDYSSYSKNQNIPSLISEFSSVTTIDETSHLLNKKRIRIATNHTELKTLFRQHSITVVNRLSDVKSALNNNYEQYLELLSCSTHAVTRYIMCSSESEFEEFKNTYVDELQKIKNIHKNKRAKINFVIAAPTIGENGMSTVHEQFILLKSFVIVLEAIEIITIKGCYEQQSTSLTGYASWNEQDLSYYRLFANEVKKLRILM